MNDQTLSFDNSDNSFEEAFDNEYLINFGNNNINNNNNNNNNTAAIHPLLQHLIRVLNANITTYNANLTIYKTLAINLQRDMKLALDNLIGSYLKITAFLAGLLTSDSKNSVWRNYNSLLSYIKSLFRLYAANLFSRIQRVKTNVLHVEETLRNASWILIRGIWMISHASTYGYLQDRQRPPASSDFVDAISAASHYIYRVYKKILQRLENIYWLVHHCRSINNKSHDLNAFLASTIVVTS